MFIGSTSFALSVYAGSNVVTAGTAVLYFFAVATPVGWVGLILTAAAVSMLTHMSRSRVKRHN